MRRFLLLAGLGLLAAGCAGVPEHPKAPMSVQPLKKGLRPVDAGVLEEIRAGKATLSSFVPHKDFLGDFRVQGQAMSEPDMAIYFAHSGCPKVAVSLDRGPSPGMQWVAAILGGLSGVGAIALISSPNAFHETTASQVLVYGLVFGVGAYLGWHYSFKGETDEAVFAFHRCLKEQLSSESH